MYGRQSKIKVWDQKRNGREDENEGVKESEKVRVGKKRAAKKREVKGQVRERI
jgi:hypothetical protein